MITRHICQKTNRPPKTKVVIEIRNPKALISSLPHLSPSFPAAFILQLERKETGGKARSYVLY